MRKKIIIVLFLIFLIPSSLLVKPAEAATCAKPLINEDVNKEIKDFKENDANMAEKFMVGQQENLLNIGDVNSIPNLVFGDPYCVWNDNDKTEMAEDGVFSTEEREKILNPILKFFSSVYVSLLVLAIMASTLKLGFRSMNGQARSEFWEDVHMWVLSAIFIAAYIPITNMVFGLNAAVVEGFKLLLEKQEVNVDGFSIISSWKDALTVMPVLSFLVTMLAEWILALILNFVYIARKVVILVLLALGYVAAYSLLFNRSRAFFGVWAKELIGNVFLQSIHGLIIFAFAMMSSLGAGVIYKLGLMIMFIPLTGMVSRWLKVGDSSSKLGTALTMTGLGGVMTTMMMTRQAGSIIQGGNFNGSSLTQNSSHSGGLPSTAYSGGDMSFSGGITNIGGGSDSPFTKISTDASGANSSTWQNTKQKISKAGGVVAGMGGMVAGPVGAAAMAHLGTKGTGAVLQGARNVSMGGRNLVSTFKDAKGYEGVGGAGFKGVMNDLSERRTFFGNAGESLGSMVGLGMGGRALGHAISGVSRQRLTSTSQELGGSATLKANGKMGMENWSDLAKRYPNADVKMMQSNKESSFWMKQGSEWKKVGLSGQADPTLRDGQVRAVDYQLPSKNSTLSLQPNGTYSNGVSPYSSPSSEYYESSPPASNETGLKGSTPNLMRKSDAYVYGVGDSSGKITARTLAVPSTSYQDTSFDAAKINPDSFVSHNMSGVDVSSRSDKMADKLHSANNSLRRSVSKPQASGWVSTRQNQVNQQQQQRKNRGIVG
jgi:hypothetical protein